MHACLSYKKAKKSPNRSQADLLDSTSVILCANPSHRTALNTRKRLVLAGTLDPKWELKFTTSLLTRRECSKEAILWHHRRWLLHRIHGVVMVSDTSPEIEPWPLSSQVVRDEFAIVSLGCELYPRNYFAWAHRYFCMKCLSLSTSPFSQSESFHPMEALIDEYQSMLYWVERHISDYSAMQYLCRVESTIQNLSITSPTLHLPGSIPSLRTHAELLLQSYPDHESIWMYLRGTATPIHSSDLPNSSMLANYGPNSLVYLARHRVWAAHEVNNCTSLCVSLFIYKHRPVPSSSLIPLRETQSVVDPWSMGNIQTFCSLQMYNFSRVILSHLYIYFGHICILW